MSGEVTGTEPGDTVKVWFVGGGERSRNFTYEVEGDTGNSVLILASEDYTGASQLNPPGGSPPDYLSYYQDALSANGVDSDVYDVDAHGRMAPDALGVLSHYDAVVWYTGDNLVTRKLGWGPGNVSRLAMQELYEVRDYINQGGRALYAGQAAGQQFTSNLGLQLYDPFRDRQCSSLRPWRRVAWPPRDPVTRRAIRSSTRSAPRSLRPTVAAIRRPSSRSRWKGSTIRSTAWARSGSTAPTAPRTT